MSDDHIHEDAQASPSGDAWLERLLADDAAAARDGYVDDDGFAARVMAKLPAPVALPTWRKPIIVALWGIAAAAVAVAVPGAALEVGREAYRLLAAQPVSLSGIAGAALALAGLTWAAAAYTLRSGD